MAKEVSLSSAERKTTRKKLLEWLRSNGKRFKVEGGASKKYEVACGLIDTV